MSFRSPYPGYDVRAKRDTPSWNEQTREALDARRDPPAPAFLDPGKTAVLRALCQRAIPQDGPDRIEIAAFIDADLAQGRGSGTRYATMPEDGRAWRIALAALEAEARARGAAGFAAMEPAAQDALLRDVDADRLQAREAWQGMPAQTWFRKLALKRIVEIYYASPQGMSEIGYGGPAAPRGYVRLGADRFDPWEAPAGQWEAEA